MRCMRCDYKNPNGSTHCAKCGCALPKHPILSTLGGLCLICAVALFIIYCTENYEPAPRKPDVPIESIAETVDYTNVSRYPDKYEGKAVTVTGTVIEVSESILNTVMYRVQDSDGNIWYVEYIHRDGEARILLDDEITCYGECNGVKTYIAVLGNTVTIPSMRMKSYSIKHN